MRLKDLDDWQYEILKYEGDILLAKGRRIGATHLFAIKAIEHLMKYENKHPSSQVLCVSITEDQAELIIAFALQYARERYDKYIGVGMDRPTKTKIIMNVKGNKRILLARPIGSTGESSRGFEGQVLMIDEAAFHNRSFFTAATPILLTTGGHIWMWSTFMGKEGYFWDRYEEATRGDPDAQFKVWHKSTEDVINERPIGENWTQKQKESALKHLEKEKKNMTNAEYSQEYLAVPLDDIKRLFSDELIEQVCTLESCPPPRGKLYGGFDIARMGEDESTFEFIDKISEEEYTHAHHEIAVKQKTTETADRIKMLQVMLKAKKLGIDTGGVGAGVYDFLLRERVTKQKVVPLNNASLALDSDDKHKKKLLKEEMYSIAKMLLERGWVHLLNRLEIKASLASIQYEYVLTKGNMSILRISGKYSHITEGIIRALYLAYKDKSLNLWASSFSSI